VESGTALPSLGTVEVLTSKQEASGLAAEVVHQLIHSHVFDTLDSQLHPQSCESDFRPTAVRDNSYIGPRPPSQFRSHTVHAENQYDNHYLISVQFPLARMS
jgi:hypothetical protein